MSKLFVAMLLGVPMLTSAACGAGGSVGIDAAGGESCLDQGHVAGERYPAGDDCNFCSCGADGVAACTARTCANQDGHCDYDGLPRAYGERFASTDRCNECVCATSGVACTQRPACGAPDDGAILLETLDAPCGDPSFGFTARKVLADLPRADVRAPFAYQRVREKYPETLPDTMATFRVRHDGGYAVCRIPAEGQEAIDLEAVAELVTDDGSFDEGFHTYLRKDRTGFVDAWYVVATLPPAALTGSHAPACLDFVGYSFSAQLDRDGSAFGSAFKTCETDLYLEVGTWTAAAP
jgi:hypothetical protein